MEYASIVMGRGPGVGPERLYSIAPKVVVSPFAPLEICRNGSGFFRIDNKISPWYHCETSEELCYETELQQLHRTVL